MDNPAYVVETNIGTPQNGKIHQRSHTFEEAISLTRVGKFHYLLLLICGLCFMAVMAEIICVSLIIPSVKCDLTSTLSEQGILASAGFFGIVMSSHIMGFFADTWGRVRTLRYALILSAISTLISAFSVNIWMLIVFRFLSGFFISGGQACVFSLCGEFHGNRSRVRHVTMVSIFLPFAFIYLPSISILILPIRIETIIFGVQFSSWRLLIMANTLISFTALLGLCTLPETPKYVLVQGDPDGALEILRKIYAKNTGASPDDFPVKSLIAEPGGASLTNIHGCGDALRLVWSQTVPLFYRERRLHTINICVILFTIYGIAQGIFMWFPTILNDMVAKSDSGLSVCEIITAVDTTTQPGSDICSGHLDIYMFQVLIMIGAAFTTFYILFAFTIDFIGKKNLLIIWLGMNILCVASIHWVSNFFIAVIVLTLVMSIGNCGGIVGTIAIEFYPTNINAMGVCFVMMIGRLGAVTGGNIFGQVLFNHCDTVLWTMFVIMCVLVVLSCLLPERKRDKFTKTSINDLHRPSI